MKKTKKHSDVTNIEINNEVHVNQVVVEPGDVICVNELVPAPRTMNDSMEKIADITDEFSQTMEPILRMYNAAMCATTARLDIIKDEFKFRYWHRTSERDSAWQE